MEKRHIFMPLVSFIIVSFAVFAGCGRNIYLSDDGYNPGASVKNIKGYKNAQINLGSFQNYAAKSKRYAYFSADKSVSYKTNNLLPDYMWYCFKKAFEETGMKVNEIDEAPSLYLIINDINDTGVKCDINLYSMDDLEFIKEIVVNSPGAAGTAESSPEFLEQNAYSMMDAVIAAILNDKGFKNKVITRPAGVPAEKKIEGTLVGIVKAVSVGANEIIVSSGKIASMVNIGDTVYTVVDGTKIKMEVNFPMQTIAKCIVLEKDRKNIGKVKNGDMVYK